ncbi:hypothetical protein [Microbaculum sp. FT89]|uniref:hypothetical protein n=1 Tax=Microbaculum sp. FT89 TaxID=3447298 RepID=UPI003F538358
MNTHVRERETLVSDHLTEFLAITPALRRLLEAAVQDALNFVESMTLFLDEVDGDADAEDSDVDEDTDPRELDEDHEPDGDEREPSLGSLEHGFLKAWAGGADDDREDEHDGHEPDPDREPSLGCVGNWFQPHWAIGDDRDLEEDVGDQCEREDGM